MRREKEAKIAEFAQAIVVRDAKQGDSLNILKQELDNKIKDDLEKVFICLIICRPFYNVGLVFYCTIFYSNERICRLLSSA